MINSVRDLETIMGYHDKLKQTPWFWKDRKFYPYKWKHQYKFYQDCGTPVFVIQEYEQFNKGCSYSLQIWKDYPSEKLGKRSNISILKKLLESEKSRTNLVEVA